MNGLKRLEYRGYDSAGIAILENDELQVIKRRGKVSVLEKAIEEGPQLKGTAGIGHTRWATHGQPSDVNSHPHESEDGNMVIIHNGIIENYGALKEELTKRGHQFKSDTDTEVLIHLISNIQKNENISLFDAVRIALNEVIGAYAIVVLDKNNPHQLIAAKKGSPMVVGLGRDHEFYVASDATPIVEHTKNVIYLDDEEIAILDRIEGFTLMNIKNQQKTPYVQELEMKLEALEKGGYEHFMLKEIYEQPRSVRDSMRGRLQVNAGRVELGGIRDYVPAFVNADRILIVACT
jgi:glucosamine--fructose-6-phosphate aminotransferase (isomerizing)